MSNIANAAGEWVLYRMIREMVVPTSSAPDSTRRRMCLMYVFAADGCDITLMTRDPVDQSREAMAAVTEMLMTSSTGQLIELSVLSTVESGLVPGFARTMTPDIATA